MKIRKGKKDKKDKKVKKDKKERKVIKGKKWVKIVAVLCILAAAAAAALWFKACRTKKPVSEPIVESESSKEETEPETEPATQDLWEELKEELATAEEIEQEEDPEPSTQTESDEESGESSEAGEKEEVKAEKTTLHLENLSGLLAGTILESEQIDFENLDAYFMSWRIEEGDNLYERINGKSYRKNDYVPLSSLRYLKLPHYNFQGQIQVGELIVNEDVEQDIIKIFKELFASKYEIQSMYLIDKYWTGDPDSTDSASIDVNNTSAFCYREITGGGRLSNHAYGRAVDINPQQNPYVSYSSGAPKWAHENANDYIARDTGLPHVITHEDLAYQLFTEAGFRWGGDWNNPKDYQHFDKNR